MNLNNNMKLEITKERVISATETCPTAKETLKALFPEAFEDEKYFNFESLECSFLEGKNIPRDFSITWLQVRSDGNLAWKGFYLDRYLNWEIVKDNFGEMVLVPTKK